MQLTKPQAALLRRLKDGCVITHSYWKTNLQRDEIYGGILLLRDPVNGLSSVNPVVVRSLKRKGLLRIETEGTLTRIYIFNELP